MRNYKNYMTELSVAEATYTNTDWDAPARKFFYAGYFSAIANLASNDKSLTEEENSEIQTKVEQLQCMIR